MPFRPMLSRFIATLSRWNLLRRESRDTRRHWLAEWVVTVLLLIFTTTTLAQAFVIPTGSMENNLLVGDHLLVDKLSYSPAGAITKYLLPYQEPRRGDIIVFRHPTKLQENYVKRVIGLPGDRIRIVEKEVIINGRPLREPYKQLKTNFTLPYRDNFPSVPPFEIFPRGLAMLRDHARNGELLVPPGHYFALGDNRDHSEDSRYWGFVPRENIIGKPLLIYWSYESTTERLSGSPLNPDHLFDLALNFFEKTRWSRSFQLVHGYPHP